jgi:1-acyl-sn-glycerol-3-phosphate acyltransferase
MLESILPWAYLWPVAMGAVVCVVLGLVVANVVLGATLLLVYFAVPSETIDQGIRWIVSGTREKFAHYFQRVEDHLRVTFPIHGVENLPASCLLLWHPHSLLSVTSVLHTAFSLTPAVKSKIVSHSMYHSIPLIRDGMRFVNSIPADFDTMKQCLDEGHRVSVLVGGVREMLDTEHKTVRLVLGKRKGVFRLALTTGRPLVPVLTYGESELFPAWNHPTMQQINQFLYSTFKIAIPLTSWKALSNWLDLYWTPLSPVQTYVGEPIVVEMNSSPSESDLSALRDIYIKQLKTLFNETHPPGYSLIIQE